MRVILGEATLVPGLVNAHSHLDLTHMGPRPMDQHGFEGFIASVRAERRVVDAEIAQSVQRGVELSRAGGVVAVGDIGGAVRGRASLAAWRALRESGIGGVSFLEFFAAGRGWEDRMAEVEDLCRAPAHADNVLTPVPLRAPFPLGNAARLGLQPHAPYSVCQAAYGRVLKLAHACGMPVCTHLAETRAEREYIERAAGPFRALLEGLGLWHDGMLAEYGLGKTPIEHLHDVIAERPILLVHLNDVRDSEIELLANLRTATVVYCPRASDYFRAPIDFGPHRYREMIAAGINVVLGTDSIVNLPSGTGRISTLDEVVYLCRRDGFRFEDAIGMATWKAADALGLDSNAFKFKSGVDLAGLVALEGLQGTGDVTLDVLQLPHGR